MNFMKEKITKEFTDPNTGTVIKETQERVTFKMFGMATLISLAVALAKFFGLM